MNSAAWIVLKFGGTSVSTAKNWQNIAEIIRNSARGGDRVLVVHSALSGVTDLLERLLDAALLSAHDEVYAKLRAKHIELADALGIVLPAHVIAHLADLEKIAAGVALVREVRPISLALALLPRCSTHVRYSSRLRARTRRSARMCYRRLATQSQVPRSRTRCRRCRVL
jgi:aspartokinase